MLMNKPKHRVFNYQPRFYKPEDVIKESRKRKLKFRYNRKYARKGKSIIYWFLLLLIVLYFYLKFSI